MKNLLVILLLLPLSVLSQTEIDQKLSFRNGTKTSQSTNTEPYQKTNIRQADLSRKKQTFENNSVFGQERIYYDYDRLNWIRWGAPISGYSNFYPFYYYDRFGLRQPGRVYKHYDNRLDTVKRERQHWRLGLSYNTDNQLGAWVAYGNKRFLMVEYSSYLTNDKSSFLPNLTTDYVMSWNDKRLDDITYGGVVYVGGGVKFNKFGMYIMPGYGWDINNFQYFDEFYILSNNGKYSFPNYTEKYFTGKFGAIYDHKYLSAKIDYNPFRNNLNFGIGIVL